MTELETLQNAASSVSLSIHERISTDRRKKVSKYFAQLGKSTISPTLDYTNMNHWLHGYITASKIIQVNSQNRLLK